MSQASPLTGAQQRARALAAAGDTAGAVALLEHAVALGKVNLGEDDPDVLSAAHQLARIHQDRDDPSAARRVLEEAYAAGQWRLGDADPLMLEISYDLGVVAEELGNRHEARKALTRVVEAGRPVLGDLHWAVHRAQLYLDGDTNAVKPPPLPTQSGAPATTHRPPPLPRRQPAPVQQPAPPHDMAPAHEEGPPGPEEQAWPVLHSAPVRHDDPTSGVRPTWPPRQSAQHDDPAPDVQPTWPPRRHPGDDPEPRLSGPTNLHLHDRRDPGDRATAGHPALPPHQPPLPAPPPVPAEPAPAPPAPAYQKRGPALFAAIAAVLAAVIAVAALVFVLADRGRDPADPDVPTLGGGPAPSDVKLQDFGSSMRVSWTDTGAGRNSFIITGGHPGEVLKPMGEVGPGATSFELQGLNDQLDYCFAVVAVYGTNSFASSAQTCTSRPAPVESD